MNEIKIFDSEEFGQVRTIMIDGEPWFVGKDVAAALGYSNHRDALCKHVDSEDRGESQFATPSGEQTMTIINESGMYSLIFGSKLESAKKFKHWVTSDILPSIRKTGGYLSASENARILGFIEEQQQFMNHQKKFNQMVVDRLNDLHRTQTGQQVESFAIIKAESESQRRKKMLNQLVSKMAKACGWERSFALHRMYQTLEDALNISLEDYLEIYQMETENEYVGIWEMIIEYNWLYKLAVKLCTNTINEMKC